MGFISSFTPYFAHEKPKHHRKLAASRVKIPQFVFKFSLARTILEFDFLWFSTLNGH